MTKLFFTSTPNHVHIQTCNFLSPNENASSAPSQNTDIQKDITNKDVYVTYDQMEKEAYQNPQSKLDMKSASNILTEMQK